MLYNTLVETRANAKECTITSMEHIMDHKILLISIALIVDSP